MHVWVCLIKLSAAARTTSVTSLFLSSFFSHVHSVNSDPHCTAIKPISRQTDKSLFKLQFSLSLSSLSVLFGAFRSAALIMDHTFPLLIFLMRLILVWAVGTHTHTHACSAVAGLYYTSAICPMLYISLEAYSLCVLCSNESNSGVNEYVVVWHIAYDLQD